MARSKTTKEPDEVKDELKQKLDAKQLEEIRPTANLRKKDTPDFVWRTDALGQRLRIPVQKMRIKIDVLMKKRALPIDKRDELIQSVLDEIRGLFIGWDNKNEFLVVPKENYDRVKEFLNQL